MKRLIKYATIAVAVSFVALSALWSCGSSSERGGNTKESLFVTIAPLRPLIQGIVGDDFDVEILVPAGASPESFEPTPRQFIALNKSQAIFAVGLIDFERNLVSRVEEQSKVIDLSHGIKLIAGSCSHNHAHAAECTHQHHTHGVDPHVWSSPVELKIMARNAYAAIAAIYPDSAKYTANYERLAARLELLDFAVRARCERARSRSFVVYHPALTYLARDYGLEQISIEHEGKEPSVKRLAGIIENARKSGTKRVFYQSTYPRSTVEVIAEDIGAEPVEIDPLREDVFTNINDMIRLIIE